jgi:tripartite-type tricarboxylate transporter receptor subunit TctC
VPVSQIAANPLILVASRASGFKTLQDVQRAAAKESKGVAIASYGYGTPSHLAIELLGAKAHIKLTHIPYNGSAKATVDLLGGQVPLLMDILPSQLQNLASGKVVGIAIGQASRSELAPSIPTFEEAGVPGVTASTWFGLVAPKGTPKEVVEKLSEAVRHAAQDPQLRKNFMARGMVPQATTPEAFGKIIREDYEKWGAVIKDSGIQKQQ